MLESLKSAVGAEPVKNDDGTYWPSKAAMKVAVQPKTVYTEVDYSNALINKDMRVLILGTDESELTCENGKVFKTGNHPTEVFTVVRHLEKAGFGIDFVSPSGGAIPLELFAVPDQDSLTSSEIKKYQEKLDHPLDAKALLSTLDTDSPYVAIYVPGGHGALLSVPFSTAAGNLLRWFIKHDKFIITICHGPAGLLSLAIEQDGVVDFPLSGYSMALFPAGDDKLMAAAGYLPGEVTWNFQKKLEDLGVKVVNHLPTGATHQDRKLLSGDSPFAADKLGQLVCHTMLNALNPETSKKS